MKANAEKSSKASTPAATREANEPFFARKGGGDFFAPSTAAVPPVQLKMAVNRPGDRFEQEADKMSDRVMQAETPPSPVQQDKPQRQAAEGPPKPIMRKGWREEDGERRHWTNWGEFQRKERTPAEPEVSPQLQSAIQRELTGGIPIGADVRSDMATRFGADFSKVRIHTDSESAILADQLNAKAFTYQNHIFFSNDQYQPDNSEGKQLLAHELTHTLQQGHAVQKKGGPPPDNPEDMLRRATKAPAPPAPAITSSQVVDISTGTFDPPPKVQEEIAAQGRKGLDVRVIVKGVTSEGKVKIRVDSKKNYHSIGWGSMPLVAPWADLIGGLHINFTVTKNEIKGGFAALKPGGGSARDWLPAVQKNTEALGGLGLKVQGFPKAENKFEGGKLTLSLSKVKVEIADVIDAELSMSVENAGKPVIEASADINVKGIAKGQLKLDNSKEKLAGQISLAVEYKNFNGSALIKYNPDGSVDIGGKAHYDADKLSGELQFVSTDLETANNFAKDAIKAAGGKENVQEAPPPAPVPPPKPGRKKRGLAAMGTLAFHLTDWFAGTVFVVVDGKGDITVIGKIAPPAEVPLMKSPKDWDVELIHLEARAFYGIPVVGDVHIFGGLSLHALASLGPAKIYNIEILGTYSTDPEIQKSIQISGSINISGYAGIRLRAEGGAGVTILKHDIKFGIGINVDVGVKAYADARPTIGLRDPGVFFISGTLEMVAQPVLGLGGEFFIELSTPWWSPLHDDRWPWPLFSLEWPLGDPIGLSAVMKEYQLGSGKVPEIELKKPEFDAGKFMSKMVDKDLPPKTGAPEKPGQGSFKDDGTVPKPEVPPKKPAPKKPEGKAPKKGPPPKEGKSAKPNPNSPKEKESGKILQDAAQPMSALKAKGPFGRAEINQELGKIKAQVHGISFDLQLKTDTWVVTPKAGKRAAKPVELHARKEAVDGAAKADERTPEQQTKDVHAAIAEVEATVGLPPDRETAKKHFVTIKAKFKLTDLFIEELPNGAFDVVAVINPRWKTAAYPPRESKYVFVDVDNRRKLRPDYRGSFKIRTRFYLLGQGYGRDLDKKILEKVAARSYRLENGQYIKDPDGEYWIGDPDRPSRFVTKKSPNHPTVEHPIPVREHWNTQGNRTDQTSRRGWVTFKGREDEAPIVDFQTNRAAPTAGSEDGYTEVVEESFKGPGEK